MFFTNYFKQNNKELNDVEKLLPKSNDLLQSISIIDKTNGGKSTSTTNTQQSKQEKIVSENIETQSITNQETLMSEEKTIIETFSEKLEQMTDKIVSAFKKSEETEEELDKKKKPCKEQEVSKTEAEVALEKQIQDLQAQAQTEKENLEKEIKTLKQKEIDAQIASEKQDVLKKVNEELSFADGTPEENAEKLYSLKVALGENNTELYDFVLVSLKKQSEAVEALLDEAGTSEDTTEETPQAKAERLASELAKKEGITEAKAYRQVLDSDPELQKQVYSA